MAVVYVLATRRWHDEDSITSKILKRKYNLFVSRRVKVTAKRGAIFRPVQRRIVKDDKFKWPVEPL
jgi:hypothetical protein